jgi:hypothetical protein
MLAETKGKSAKLEKIVAEMQSGIDFLKYIGLTDVL